MASESNAFVCPACGGTLLVEAENADQTGTCPMCQADVTIPAIDQSMHGIEDARSDELDHARITQHATLRQALYRSRSYAIIAAVVCAVAIVQLCFSIYHAFRAGAILYTVAYLTLSVLAAIGARYFYRRAEGFHREAMRSQLHRYPQTPADFSTLSDGSRRWEDLNEVR